MASFSETLSAKRGGVPTWGWFAIGVGALVIVMFLRNKNSAAASASSDQSATTGSDLGSPEAAAALSQGAYPMAYMGGDIYNNLLQQNGPASPAPPPGPAPTEASVAGDTLKSDQSARIIPYKVKSGDTWADIGKNFGISAQHVFLAQPSAVQQSLGGINKNPPPGTIINIPYNTNGPGNLPPGKATV